MRASKRINLLVARKACNLTQEELASYLGVSRATYASYETGRRLPSLPTAQRIALVLGKPIEWLFPIDATRPGVRDDQAATLESA